MSVLMIVLMLITVILFYVRDIERDQIDHRNALPEAEYSNNDHHLLSPSQQESESSNGIDKESGSGVNPFYPEDLNLQLRSDQGKVKDQQPFGNQSIRKISIFVNTSKGEETFSVAPETYNIIVQALYSVDLSDAKAHIPEPSKDGTVFIRFHTDDTVYSVPYDLNTNTYMLSGQRYYATYNTMAYLNLFCRPETTLAMLGKMRAMDVGTDEMPYVSDQSVQYDVKRLKVQGNNFEEWSNQIEGNNEYKELVNFYSIRSDKIKTILVNEHSGILFTGASVFFTKDGVKTADGITIGTSTYEVMSRLGVPNLILQNKWSYQVDKERQLHLYFKEEKVMYMTLTRY